MRNQFKTRLRGEALELLRKDSIFHELLKTVRSLGVIGEKKNILALYVAGLTKDSPRPVSVMVKGSSSSGKSNLVRSVLKLFPSDDVIERSSLSEKAIVKGEAPLGGKILYIAEYKGGKDAQYLIRLQQTEGTTKHEYTTVKGIHHSTQTSERQGSPLVITTTTEERVFEDDETRFLSLRADESAEQTQRVLRAQSYEGSLGSEVPLEVWHEVAQIMKRKQQPLRRPAWFQSVVNALPTQRVRIRRDWLRFLALIEAIAKLRLARSKRTLPAEISFQDYCVAFWILGDAFQRTPGPIHQDLIDMLKRVNANGSAKKVTATNLSQICGITQRTAYKLLNRAKDMGLAQWDGIKRTRNLKCFALLHPREAATFLPTPARIFKTNPDLGEHQICTNPIDGKEREFRRRQLKEKDGE